MLGRTKKNDDPDLTEEGLVIKDWEDELVEYGFSYKKWSSSETGLVRYIGNIQQQIWDQRVEHNGRKFFINTFISVEDNLLPEQQFRYVPVLGYRLADDGVVLPRSDTGVGRHWKKEETKEALSTLIKYALPWFEEYSSPDKLIEYVTNDVVVRPVSDKTKTNSIWFFKSLFLAKSQKTPNEAETLIRPINHRILSLLYWHTGETDKACEHAKEYLKFVKKGGAWPGEPDRTIRQLREMGCSNLEGI
jgi:hypothetical protein